MGGFFYFYKLSGALGPLQDSLAGGEPNFPWSDRSHPSRTPLQVPS